MDSLEGQRWGKFITTDDYATIAACHTSGVEWLSSLANGFKFAWELMMTLACGCYSIAGRKDSGDGDRKQAFQTLDDALLPLIECRAKGELVEDVLDGWINDTHKYLDQRRAFLEKYGAKGYFPKSLARLEELGKGTPLTAEYLAKFLS